MNKLEKLLKYVSENVPFYIEYFKENPEKNPIDIQEYPILTKKYYADNIDEFISKEYNKESLEWDKTSGTTGIPLKVYRTKREYYSEVLPLWRTRKLYNIVPSSRKLCFYLDREITKDVDEGYVMEASNELVVGLYDFIDGKKTDIIYKKIEEYQPEYVRCTPTAICNFANYYKKRFGINCEYINYIESQSEYLFDFQKEIMHDFFPNAIISNEYGCTEVLGIAQEKPFCNGLHVLEDNVYLEICDDNDNITRDINVEGDILITGLNAFSMPFIRYRIGDRGKFVNHKCLCQEQIVEVIAGRSNDFIKLADGRCEHSAVLVRIVDKINEKYNQIIKFKFVQKSYELIDVFISIKESKYEGEVKQLFYDIHKESIVKDIKCNLLFVEFNDISQKKSKFGYFECQI